MDEMQNQVNEEAYNCLDQAMCRSSLVTKKELEKGEIDWEHVYPTTREETEDMEEWLKQAQDAVEDPNDADYTERYNRLSEIVEWSKGRHRSWLWQLIAGALLGAGIFYYFEKDNEDDIARAKEDVAAVEKWETSEGGLDITKMDAKYKESHFNDHLNSPRNYKMYKLSEEQSHLEYGRKQLKQYQAMADTATDASRKEGYLKNVEYYKKSIAKSETTIDSVGKMNYAEIKEYALNSEKRWLKNQEDHSKNLHNFMIYLFILIPLYIISGYPRGYTITRHRRMSGCLTSFRKVGFAIAGFFFGAGLLASLLPDDVVKTTYSDGHSETHTEANAGNFLVLFLKFVMMAIGAFIFCFVSAFIMTIETILGLKRNFDWGAIFASIKNKASKAEERAESPA